MKLINDSSDLNYISFTGLGGNHKLPYSWGVKELEWNRRQEKYYAGDFPLLVDIETSNSCNLRCKMCNLTFDKKHFIGKSVISAILDDFKNECPYSVKLNWRGEPLLNTALPNIILKLKAVGVKEIQMNTNGTLLTPSLSERIVSSGIDRVKVSVDSIYPNEYKSIRGTDLYKVIDNIYNLINIRGDGLPIVQVQMVDLKKDKKVVEEYYDFWKDKVDYIGVCRKHSNSLGDRGSKVPCSHLFHRLTISYLGDITVCCMDSNLVYKLGNIKDMSLKDAWNCGELNKLRTEHKSGMFNSICKGCTINNV